MKQIVSLMLLLSMVMSLLAGCGGSPAEERMEETTLAATIQSIDTTESAIEPSTEPTLSAEEVLYNSLSDRMKQAVDIGIVELSQLEDLNRIVTVGEASAMLQKAYVHRTGTESIIKQMVFTIS